MIGRGDRTGQIDLKQVATGLGCTRAVIGITMAARPALLSRFLGVDSTTATRVGWATRMIGVREVAIGAGTLAAVVRGSDLLPWFMAQLVADGGDTVVVAAAVKRRQVWRSTGLLVALAAAGGAAAGGYGAVRARG